MALFPKESQNNISNRGTLVVTARNLLVNLIFNVKIAIIISYAHLAIGRGQKIKSINGFQGNYNETDLFYRIIY